MASNPSGIEIAKSAQEKVRIFVSYARQDYELARRTVDVLESAGHSVWWDRELKGEPYRAEILAQLKASNCVVVIWSKSSVSSTWVHDEADEGKTADRLVALRAVDVDFSDIPLGFRHMNLISMDNEAGLLATVKTKTGSETIGQLTNSKPTSLFKRVIRNPVLYVGLSVALLCYVVFPGFLVGIALGLLMFLLAILWLSN